MRSFSAQVDKLFAVWDRSDSPGCMLGLIKDGELIYQRAYGMANLEYGAKLDSGSVFYIASTSKQFAAASIVLLARRGTLSFDDDIRRYVPEVPQYGAPIRVGNLVYHTSGLRDYLELSTYAGRSQEAVFDTSAAIRMVSRQRGLNFPTGTRYEYSNSNYVLMAEIVRRTSGKSLREFAEESIFRPLGMTHTHFDDDHRQVVARRVVSYEETAPGRFRHFIKGIDAVGDGNLLTTIEDLQRWDENFYHERVGGQGFTRQMTTCGKLEDGREIEYAAGLFVGSYRGLPVVHHGGAYLGFRAQLLRFPEQRLSVICLANLAGIDAVALSWQVADIVLGQEGVPLAPRSDTPEQSESPAPANAEHRLPAAALGEYAGRYQSEELDVTHAIDENEGQLEIRLGLESKTLAPSGTDEFQMRWSESVSVPVKFFRDAGGRISGFELMGYRVKSLRFERLTG